MMKKDLVASIGIALIGAIVSFIICDLLIGEIEPVSFQTIDSSISTDLVEPDPEVFNYESLNPTVEVYVGDCTVYNSRGECIEETNSNQGNE